MSSARIVLLPGDGIGPEVMAEGVKVLKMVAEIFGHQFEFEEHLIGGASIDATGEPLGERALADCRDADAVLLGAVGGPKWDDPSSPVRPEQGLLRIRKELGLFANLRPVRMTEGLASASPLKETVVNGADLLVVRELTGGIYFGEPRYREGAGAERRAVDTLVYTAPEIERVVQLACELARGRRKHVTSVDKANVLDSSRLWREVAGEVAAANPDIKVENGLVDSVAMKLVSSPTAYDVIVTGNMFGDILSDEASILAGSLGMLPSASLAEGRFGLYEPVHGSAPDITGKGLANPVATVLSVAMMLRTSLGLGTEAQEVEAAVDATLAAGYRTRDLAAQGAAISTSDFGTHVVENLEAHARKE
ncbi:MAG: 3-isopropylmalate dehydrogenase [Spirochaetes bacterium]|jgi:3-isopropylmalate dehydrogenase|nr:3-isopropylmalate dehydrogenase [Spirochaetota bacterium]